MCRWIASLWRCFLHKDPKHSHHKSMLWLICLSFSMCSSLFFMFFLNPSLSPVSQRCDRSGDNRLDHIEIEEFCRELMRRPELDGVFRHYSSNGCVLSTAELRDFLGDQGEDASLNHAQSLILTYELNDWGKSSKQLLKDFAVSWWTKLLFCQSL